MEYELLDTGVFNSDRYFDVFVEYAKQRPEDILIQISVCNRGPEPATLHVLPTLWFRNTWSWSPDTPKPSLKQITNKGGYSLVAASHTQMGERYLYCEREADEFYEAITPERASKDEARVMRQALAGMLWSKQYFGFDVGKWLQEHGVDPRRPGGTSTRNSEWSHMINEHVISMPDKWEY